MSIRNLINRSRIRSWRRRSERLARKKGRRVWTRQLVSCRDLPDGSQEKRVFFASYPLLAFRCTFLGEDGDKHIRVRGPDGEEYTVHKCYAGANPAVTVPFAPPYQTSRYAEDAKGLYRELPSIAFRHVPGTSMPDDTTEELTLRYTYPPPEERS